MSCIKYVCKYLKIASRLLYQGGVPFKSGCKDRNLFLNTKIFGEVFYLFFVDEPWNSIP
jgi:hypothetical protein